ncbi:MAG: DMT family transporter [Deltaproteobacteria bacterium]|nr:DMT family transporter [Deltaproteobacteria bacterium]
MTKRKFTDWALLLACNLIWASQFVLVKLVQDQVGPVFATAAPMLVATLVLMPMALPGLIKRWVTGGRPQPPSLADVLGFVALGVLGQVAAQLFVTWGVRISLASNAALLMFTLPVVTALMAFVVLRERMTTTRWVGFALAMLGTLACSARDFRGFDLGGSYLWGNGLIFLAVVGSAFYNVYSKKLLQTYSALQVLFLSYVAVCVVLVPLTLWLEPQALSQLRLFSGQTWLGLALLALLQYALSMVIFLSVLSRLDATQAALSNYMIPAFGLVLAWLVLHEKLTFAGVAGGALVLASTWMVTVVENRQAAAQAAASASSVNA